MNTIVTGSENLALLVLSGLVVTNATAQTISGTLSFVTNFSAFSPGGPVVGVSIDDPTTQDASFASFVSGSGVQDSHSCSVGFEGYSAQGVFSPTSCGVFSPDSSNGQFLIDLVSIAPGQSDQIPYEISITADFLIPEPSSVSVLAIGLFGIAALLRQKRKANF